MPISKISGNKERFYRALSATEERPQVDPITFEIIKNRLDATTNEMGATVHSMAHSPVFAEVKDFSCGLFDHKGRMVGMGQFLPIHQGGMQSNIDGIVDMIGLENMHDGDIFMSNDVFYGAHHPPDVVLCKPVFYEDELVGMSATLVHHLDMGGTAPATYWAGATEIYQEGIRFPPTTKLYDRGKLREDILNIFLTNVRMPEPQRADLMAQVGGCFRGAERVKELAKKYGNKTLRDTYTAIQFFTDDIVRKFITELPDGVYESEDYVEGDGHTADLFKIKCTMTVKGDHITMDLCGSSKQARGYINSPWATTSASAYAPLMAIVPRCPRCYGLGLSVDIIAEKGSIVSPEVTAPIMTCTTEAGQILYNVIWHCLTQAHPSLGSGIWSGALTFHYVWGHDPRINKDYITIDNSVMAGGGGARKTMDGWPVGSQKSSNLTLPNLEIFETLYPVLYRYRHLCRDEDFPGSGVGTFRGGPGVEMEMGPVDTDLKISATSNKFVCPPAGVFGGGTGHLSRGDIRNAKTGAVRKKLLPKVLEETLDRDEILYWASVGGGGYGSPLERDPEMVRQDVINGFVSVDSARKYYGVAINEDFQVDKEVTNDLRSKLHQEGS